MEFQFPIKNIIWNFSKIKLKVCQVTNNFKRIQ